MDHLVDLKRIHDNGLEGPVARSYTLVFPTIKRPKSWARYNLLHRKTDWSSWSGWLRVSNLNSDLTAFAGEIRKAFTTETDHNVGYLSMLDYLKRTKQPATTWEYLAHAARKVISWIS